MILWTYPLCPLPSAVSAKTGKAGLPLSGNPALFENIHVSYPPRSRFDFFSIILTDSYYEIGCLQIGQIVAFFHSRKKGRAGKGH
jgi:hypothetical protein